MKSFFQGIITTVIGVVVGLIVFFMILPVVLFSLARMAPTGFDRVEKDSVLHLHLNGVLEERVQPMDFDFITGPKFLSEDESLGLYQIIKAIHAAKDDKKIRGVYLEFGRFATGWASATSLRQALQDFAASGKFVYAYADSYDEKSLYLASVAQNVFLTPAGALQLNGLAVHEMFFKGLLEKLEVEPRIFRVGKFKSAVEPFLYEKMSEENRAQTQALIDDIWGVERKTLSQRYQKTPEALDSLVAGLTLVSSAEALSSGLVQKIAFEDEVRTQMQLETVGEKEELRLVTPLQYLQDPGTQSKKSHPGRQIAVLFVDGEIVSGESHRGVVGSTSFLEDMRDIRNDEDIRAVVLRVNSPGGDALAADVMWREVDLTDQVMPVVASFGDVAASGGYYIAAGARSIVAEPTTLTGSIGVFGILADTQKFFKNKLGVGFDRVVTHPYADLGNPNRPMAEAETTYIQKGVQTVYNRFLDVVQEGRGFEKREELMEVAEGRVWSGVRAKELKLVDELGGLEKAIATAAEQAQLGKDYEVILYPEAKDPVEEILHLLSGQAARAIVGEWAARQLQQLPAQLRFFEKTGVYARMLPEFSIE